MRTRTLTFSVAGDTLTGELTDAITGTDTFGGACNVHYRLSAHRTSKTPPAGDPEGADCGGLGCSGARCAIGNQPKCAPGVCLYDTTVSPADSICTAPCDAAHSCPTGFICLSVSQSFDVPTGRSYCGRARAICGNHVVETGEECDDGNTVSGDGCSATCKREGCGNGVLEVGEECDPGLASSSDIPCSSACTYTTPAGTHVIAPTQPGMLYANLVAPAAGGNIVTAMLLTGTPTAGTNQMVSRRLSQQGATADPMVKLAEGAGLSAPHLSVSSGGVRVRVAADAARPPRSLSSPGCGHARARTALDGAAGQVKVPMGANHAVSLGTQNHGRPWSSWHAHTRRGVSARPSSR